MKEKGAAADQGAEESGTVQADFTPRHADAAAHLALTSPETISQIIATESTSSCCPCLSSSRGKDVFHHWLSNVMESSRRPHQNVVRGSQVHGQRQAFVPVPSPLGGTAQDPRAVRHTLLPRAASLETDADPEGKQIQAVQRDVHLYEERGSVNVNTTERQRRR